MSIGENAFNKCDNIISVTIPNSVISIGNNAFWNCTNLTSVTIGKSLASSTAFAFGNCLRIETVNITDLDAWCKIDFLDNEFATPLCYGKGNLYLNGSLLSDAIIPNTVTTIKSYTFSCCKGMTSVTIPNSVTSIQDYAFYTCRNLTNIIFQGTMEQWETIAKDSNWNLNTGSYTIHCTDGDIAKS